MKLIESQKKLNFAIVLVLSLSFFINICGIGWGLPSFHGWAIDEIIPAQVLDGIEQGFSNGWYYKYPPFHYYVLTIFYTPFLILDWLNVVDVSSLPTYTVLFYIERFVSVVMSTTIVYLVYLCGLEIYDKKTSILAALMTALNCTFVYYSKTANLEIPFTFWFVLSLLFYLRILKHQKMRDYLLFSTAAVISVCTKDQAYGFYLLTPIFIVLVHHLYQKRQNITTNIVHSLTDKKIIFSLLLSVTLFFILQNVIFNLEGFIAHILELTSQAGDASKKFDKTIIGYLQLFRQTLKLLMYSLGLPVLIVGSLGLLIAFLKPKKNYLLLCSLVPTLSYYVFYIGIISYVRDRFLLPITIVLVFFGANFIFMFLICNQKFFKIKTIFVSILLIYTFIYSASINSLMTQDSRYYVEKWMKQNIRGDALVLGIGHKEYLPRLQNFKYVSLQSPSLSNSYLLQLNPDYVVTTSSFDIRRSKKGTSRYQLFSSLYNEKNSYKLVLKYKSKPRWNLLRHQEKLSYKDTNLDKINPEIRIYRKTP
ncbi:glycosyltransferase family 39 protein [Coleofasciculus sp. LEGE 07092]|nr:glycosyltransferase family 39 protein [Coleofasciculus sp. LEGE 07081]MBE9147470.1 glycosyltransferase family 39 protein [Coleofasciculus sp. LEGE 07092]